MVIWPPLRIIWDRVTIMINKIAILAGSVLVASIGAVAPVEAAPVTVTHEYGTGPGRVTPDVGGYMMPGYVIVVDVPEAAGTRFYDAIDFGNAGFETINSLTLTLSVNKATGQNKDWRVYGSTNGGNGVADGLQLGDRIGGSLEWSFVLSSGSVFDQAIAAGNMAFWFVQQTKPGSTPFDFWLYSASVTVDGVAAAPAPAPAPIPLPAAGLLLVGSLGGFVLLRRRSTGTPVL